MQPTGDTSSCAGDFRTVEPDVRRYPVGGDLNADYYQGILENMGNVSFVVKGQFTHSMKG